MSQSVSENFINSKALRSLEPEPSAPLSGSFLLAPRASALWTGRVLSALAMMFLGFDASLKLLKLAPAVEATTKLGYSENVIVGLGVVQLICLVVYVFPRTAVLGAVLWTGYLGGAVATHIRVGSPLFSHVLFPVYIGALLWVGLWLRDPRLRALFQPYNKLASR
jgi:hypothetical protein